jgi:ABC-type nitrate/sulfonate/bicarbonate transport system permease component
MRLRRVASYGPAVILTTAFLLLWQSYVALARVSPFILPPPTAMLQALITNWDLLYGHMLQTLVETLIGLVISVLLGVLIAVLLDMSSWVRRALYPLLLTSQTVPMVALAPLLLVWFGYGLMPKVLLVILYCFFPIAVACADGLMSVEPELIRLMQSMRASRWQVLWLVRLPGAMPSFFSGLRIAVTYSVTGAIVGEYVGAEKGLGLYMQTSANSFAMANVLAAVLLTVILTMLLFALVALIERLALPWYFTAARMLR